MQKKIADTTAAYSLGSPMQARLFTVPSGSYVGRRVALMQTSSAEIKLAWSDAPSAGWSSPTAVASDAADGCFDARMAPNGDIHLVYGEQSTHYLVTRKLAFANGAWAVGSRVAVYDGAQCYDPSLGLEPGGRIWVSYSYFVSPNRRIFVKSSDDDGATWGSGSTDAGTQLSGSSMFAWSRVIIDNNSIHVVYHDQDTALSIRSLPLTGGSWSSQYNIATGSGFSSFDVGVGGDGRLGVAWCRDQLYYREFDGSNWGAVATIATYPALSPQVLFEGNIPAVVYLDDIGGDIKTARFCDRRTGSFESSQVLDGRSAPFDAVLLYNAATATYQDVTSQAVSSTVADVYHPSSGSLLKDPGDRLYLGMDERFRLARFILSTVGTGGSVRVSYWDGVNWEAFTPANGSVDLGAGAVDVLLWSDYDALPDAWQKCLVNSRRKYWLQIEVISAYATGPIADQIAAASDITRMSFRR